jgi:hypothetical protein
MANDQFPIKSERRRMTNWALGHWALIGHWGLVIGVADEPLA